MRLHRCTEGLYRHPAGFRKTSHKHMNITKIIIRRHVRTEGGTAGKTNETIKSGGTQQ